MRSRKLLTLVLGALVLGALEGCAASHHDETSDLYLMTAGLDAQGDEALLSGTLELFGDTCIGFASHGVTYPLVLPFGASISSAVVTFDGADYSIGDQIVGSGWFFTRDLLPYALSIPDECQTDGEYAGLFPLPD